LDKVRVYELAKELNTTSKRLMEKLAEINIIVKNHMSLIEKDELDALYKHIGVINHEEKKEKDEEKRTVPPAPVQTKPEVKKETKNAPRIIRTTEIIINSDDNRDSYSNQKKDLRGGKSDRTSEYIRSSDSNSGLLAGFVRKSTDDYLAAITPVKTTPAVKNEASASKPDSKHARPDVKPDVRKDTKSTDKEAVTQKKEEKQTMSKESVKSAAATKKETVKTKKETDKIKPEVSTPQSTAPQSAKNAGVQGAGIQTEAKAQSAKETKEHIAKAVQPDTTGKGHSVQVTEQPQAKKVQQQAQRTDINKQGSDKAVHQSSVTRDDRTEIKESKPQARAGYRQDSKKLTIPMPDASIIHKEELGYQKGEGRREFISKDIDIDKDAKRALRKETPKMQPGRVNRKIKATSIGLSEKKGVSEILSEEFILNEFYDEAESSKRRLVKPKKNKELQQKHIPQRAVLTSITIPETITVKNLAEALKKTSSEIIKKLMSYGLMATLNEEIDFDTATIIADEYGVKTEKAVVISEEDILFDDSEETDPTKLVPRPPVVVVMGHVDHGKTSLLDAIRSTNVIESEAGGITQHIGAYTVTINDRTITFLDTPGHEAFTAMRARGAQVTDIAILVVAADDGVMPQTVEAINHAKAANVSIIVAINKVDKPGANPDKVKQELTQHGLVPEEWGGDVICVNVSAKKHENIDQLLEMVLLTADMLELKADPNRQAKGTVIEAKLDKNRGPLATVLVQRGTLKVGDCIVTGATVGRIRAMIDDKGNTVKSAGPSTPVEILGLSEVPEAGEVFYAVEDEKLAKHLAEKRKIKQKEKQLNATSKVSLDDLFKQIQEGNVKELNLIIKADVQGSVEAVKQSLEKLSNDEVRIKVIHDGVGAITESDVTLADVSNAIIIGFNVRPSANVATAAENAGVDIRTYRVIYDAIEDIEAAMKGMLEPKFKEVVTGHTEVRQIFKVSGVGTIAGCYVLDGKITRNSDVRVIRDGVVIHEGKLASLKRFKDDVKEVLQGFECGVALEKFNDIKEKDIIESYTMEEIKQ